MQNIVFDGRIIPNTAKNQNLFMYFPSNEAEKKASFCVFRVSTRRPFAKKGDDGYYPTDIIPVKAFGSTADMVHNYFKGGDPIIVTGHFNYDIGGTKEDGSKYPDRLTIVAEKVDFCLNSKSNGEDSNSTSASQSKAPVSSARPAARRNPMSPF